MSFDNANYSPYWLQQFTILLLVCSSYCSIALHFKFCQSNEQEMEFHCSCKLYFSYCSWMQSQKRQNDLCFQGKPFNIMVIQAYAPTSNTEEDEVEWFCEELQDLLELTTQKICPFHYRGQECKSRKSRNTWSNRQIWPWNME